MIKAPYNFVPLSDKVFFPPWAEQVSHDIPFSDGESGEIDITITAKSPIFIRDHKKQEEFCQDDKGNYYIPGSSVKGMIRNVLEIMSFSKMQPVDDKRYAVRDLSRSDNFYLQEMQDPNDEISCGWLTFHDGVYKIEDCGIPLRIKYNDIQDKFTNFQKELFLINDVDLQNRRMSTTQRSNVNLGSFDNINSPYKKAQEKYKLIGEEQALNSIYNFEYLETDEYGKELVRFSDNGDIRGKLVLTGHPSARVESWDDSLPNNEKPKTVGKIFDFVFEDFVDKKYFTIDQDVIDNFKFSYFDGRVTQPKESEDWKYWKDKLYHHEQQVPVFFKVGENKDGKRYVKHFGLSYLYKLPYKHTISKGIGSEHFNNKPDLAETIFGYIDDDKSLKGRVQFSHFLELHVKKDTKKMKYILGLPRPSYYPIYIRQNLDECHTQISNYKTYMDNFVLAGRKRYPIRINPENVEGVCAKDDKVSTCFVPLLEDTVFTGKIRLHNLKKSEIGALISAFTFHNTKNTFHNIGLAKAYGLGKIELDIRLKGFEFTKNEYLQSFENIMSSEIDNWINTSQLTELVTMASEQNDNNLEYMNLTKGQDSYVKNKNSKAYLCLYSQLEGVTKKHVQTVLDVEI